VVVEHQSPIRYKQDVAITGRKLTLADDNCFHLGGWPTFPCGSKRRGAPRLALFETWGFSKHRQLLLTSLFLTCSMPCAFKRYSGDDDLHFIPFSVIATTRAWFRLAARLVPQSPGVGAAELVGVLTMESWRITTPTGSRRKSPTSRKPRDVGHPS
jgi:hypothetical protein